MTGKFDHYFHNNRITQIIVLSTVVFAMCVAVYSIFIIVMNLHNQNAFVLGFIMLGVSSAAIWFGITHFGIQSSEYKIQKIHQQTDKMAERLKKKK
jgi:membrane-anchored glycerophosphoryl diester phosphodiesterase (GDPDase)